MAPSTREAKAKEKAPDAAPPASEAEPGSKHKADPGSEGASESPKAKRNKTEIADGHSTKKETEETKSAAGVEAEKTEYHGEEKDDRDKKSAVEPHGRDAPEAVPSSILEKGIIYFFFRGRVGIDEPSAVNEIARSYIILRPIERDAKLGSGPIGDAGNSRLCAIPKKVLPQSGKDRWIAFVEKTSASFQQLKDEFLASNDYETKTAGTRHSPAATPVAEGVYAITSTGSNSHLAYILTVPEELGEVQKELGLKQKGSFIISTRNPQYPAPANARLPKGPEYPEEVLKEFRSRRWMPTQPKHLDIVNTQFLLIGESSGVEKALEPQKADDKENKEEPAEELEKLEEEDLQRLKGLSDDDSGRVFADLEVNANDYPKLQTTF
ncbi:hypothetical protein NEUTE2DRAFT_99499 [Neurospora tetrasperma FGSC 2509]|nr:hypothetical protein NEUTE2DRAFT_99499 [Neurospora tetrasperma FGSC 2509]